MLKKFSTKTELAYYFCDELVKLVSQKNEFFLCLSGGRTPEIIFQTISKKYKNKINWAKVHLFWGDERIVPPDDNESNYGMTKKYLLNFINIPEENIHRIRGENDPEKEAVRYSEEIKNNVPFNSGYPDFDLIMLGLGEDGHTASIFPNQMNLLHSEKICEVAIHPSNGQKRITLSGNVINNAKEITILVTGKSKSEILKKVLTEKNNALPAEFIQPVTGNLKYFIDEAAAQLL